MSGRGALASLAMALALCACGRDQGGSTTNSPAPSAPAAVPLGQIAGASGSIAALSTPNPYQDNPQAIEQGKQLFGRMNCAGCHAYGGGGNMGPDLTDTYWRYGGLPIQIYNSIFEGRPQGMPSWGKALPPDDIWKLVAYVQSLGGAVPVAEWDHARQGDQAGEYSAPEASGPQKTGPQE